MECCRTHYTLGNNKLNNKLGQIKINPNLIVGRSKLSPTNNSSKLDIGHPRSNPFKIITLI